MAASGKTSAETRAERIALAGLAFDRLSEAELVQRVIDGYQTGAGGWVAPANIDVCRKSSRDPAVKALMGRATLVVPDGMPLIWAARIKGEPFTQRVAGSSLIFSISEAAAAGGRSIYLLGGASGVPEAAGRSLAARYPGLDVAGAYSPPYGFESSREEMTKVADRLRQAEPDIVYVGLGFPKQERLVTELVAVLPGTWFICCGAAIPFAAGTLTRAPGWMQRSGLEWVHRLVSEPSRLYRRYLLEDLPYAVKLILRSAAARITGR